MRHAPACAQVFSASHRPWKQTKLGASGAPLLLTDIHATLTLFFVTQIRVRTIMPTNCANEFEIIRGAPAIAKVIGETERRTYALLEAGFLPAQKEGRLWVTTRARLQRHYNGDGAAA
jgi:hypothetical protein